MANFTGTITNNVPNTSYVATVDSSKKLTIVLTCNNGYVLDGKITGSGYDYNGDYVSDSSVTVTNNTDNTACTIVANGDFSDSSTDFTIDGKTISKSAATADVQVNANLTNCTGTGYKNMVSNGDVLNITVTANDNCLFDGDTPVVAYNNNLGVYTAERFTVADDKKTATITFTVPPKDKIGSKAITIVANANVQQAVTGGYGLINVYVTNDNELNQFAKTRFYKPTGDGTTGATLEVIDLGKYVNRLQRLYFNIPVKTTDVIKCGNYNTGVNTHTPVDNKVSCNFGSVQIPNDNGNSVDLKNDVQLFLPFVGFVPVDNRHVGSHLYLTLAVDIITGTGVYKLIIDDKVIAVYDCKPCTDVIYRTGDYDLRTIGESNFNNDVDKGIKPYLYVARYHATGGNNRTGDNRRVQIGTMTGYNQFDDVTVISTPTMLQTEQAQIYDKLRTGVYINANG